MSKCRKVYCRGPFTYMRHAHISLATLLLKQRAASASTAEHCCQILGSSKILTFNAPWIALGWGWERYPGSVEGQNRAAERSGAKYSTPEGPSTYCL